MVKYSLFAYPLWLLFGWLGVHHFYLRRHRQGVLWLTSFSGVFGIGKAARADGKALSVQWRLQKRHSVSPWVVAFGMWVCEYRPTAIVERNTVRYLVRFKDICCLHTHTHTHTLHLQGWLRDFWRIPTYVKDANDDIEFREQLKLKVRYSDSGPRVFRNWHLLVAQVLFGVFYRGLVYCAIPWDSSVMEFAVFLIPIGTAFGTYMVINVGRQKSPFHVSLLGAYIGEFLMGEGHLLYEESGSIAVAGVAAICTITSWEWRKDSRGKKVVLEDVSCGKMVLTALLACFLFVGLCSSFVYFNASVETEDGETIKVRDALENFFNSPAWQQIKTAFWVLLSDMYESWRTGGYEKAWSKFVDLADIEGEDHAYDVLGLERGTEFKEVRKRYKELAKEWHPDHHQGEEMKNKAQEQFMKYNNAYKILEGIHKRRKKYGDDYVD